MQNEIRGERLAVSKRILVVRTIDLQISRRRSDGRREIYNPIDATVVFSTWGTHCSDSQMENRAVVRPQALTARFFAVFF